jgi:acetyl esterase/lipase
MDQLPPLGRIIPLVVGPTGEIYGPILVANSASAINATTRETHSYGSHPRQQLDVYKPSSTAPKPPAGKLRPVFVFVYGGGFVNGDKVLARMPEGLVYKNVGYFFAEKLGFETIVIDYRLIGHGAKFPSGGEDVGAALEWIEKRYGGGSEQRKREIFVMGNSAGGVHLCTWLFGDQFREERNRLAAGSNGVKLAGVVFLGAVFHFKTAPPPLMEVLTQYFGDRVAEDSPLGMVQSAKEKGGLTGQWPRILVVDSELDPEEILLAGREFVQELGEVKTIELEHTNLRGHNHISPPWALGTGIEREEEWGYAVGKWCNASS